MAETSVLALNRGIISRLGLARADLKRMAYSAETMTNWIPRVLGAMSLRPGTQYIGTTFGTTTKFLRFVFSTDDAALVELTPSGVRFWINDVALIRPSVSTTITNGTFTTDLSSWTDNDEAGATSIFVAGGYMGLTGTGTNAAIRDQLVTVAAASQNVEHGLRITIQRGPVTLRVGSTVGGDEYVTETELGTGRHSIAFTPTGNFNIRLQSRLERQVQVDSIIMEGSILPVILLDTAFSSGDLSKVSYDQSGDVLFVALNGYQQRRIERRGSRSWSVVIYEPLDGPFRVENTGPITITPSAASGNITLTASAALFKSTNMGSLYRLESAGQRVSSAIAAQNTFTNGIRVVGVGESRRFLITITGTWTATVTLQRSVGVTGNWEDVQTYTTNQDATFDDGLDNQVIFYRIGIKTGNYTSGTATCTLNYRLGSITGVARVTAFTSTTVVDAEVLTTLGGTDATDIWAEGSWSSRRGFPSAVALYEGRLWWAGKNGVWGSISDAFDSFDPDFEGDAGPINRTIGSGPVDDINWLLPMQRLILGAEGAEMSVRSTTFDEPLTPSNFNIKEASTQGSKSVMACKVDSRGVFIQRSGSRIYELTYNVEINDYASYDLTNFAPELGELGFTHIAVQRQPDTRIHAVRTDGKVVIGVWDPVENVRAWMLYETDGVVADVIVLPGTVEDTVYYVVTRNINGSDIRYLEKWAKESECRGSTLNKQADCFLLYSGASTTTITGLTYLEGEAVVVWGNGVDLSPDVNGVQTTYTVTGGQITLTTAVTSAVIGLPYTGQWKGVKLSRLAEELGLASRKRIVGTKLLLADTHYKGVKFGPTLTSSEMDDLRDVEAGVAVAANTVHTAYDEDMQAFPGGWGPDKRLCLRGQAPRPCTVLGVVMEVA